MTGPDEIVGALAPEGFSIIPDRLPDPLDEDAGTVSLFQEINERRARIENAELLRSLRGL